MNSFRKTIFFAGRLAIVGCVSSLLVGCFQGSSDMAGIDGSGAPLPPIAEEQSSTPEIIGGSSSSVSIPASSEPPVVSSSSAAPPVLKNVVAHGTINGFGSVIVYGVHYDTSMTEYYRNGLRAQESDFEVGDLITVEGYEEGGVHYAQRVMFQPVISGVVETYDYRAGILTMLGQRIHLEASTIIGPGLDERHLLGRDVSISGYVADAEITATRITQNEVGTSQISGHIRMFNTDQSCFPVGSIRVCYDNLAEPLPMLRQGDLVHVTGKHVQEGEDINARYFDAQIIRKLDLTELGANAESVLISGVVRNLEKSTRFWVNSVEILLDQDTRVLSASLGDIQSGSQVVVQGTKSVGGLSVFAREIDLVNTQFEKGAVGYISDLEINDQGMRVLAIDGVRYALLDSTAIADVRMVHSRLAFEGLRVGDYVVVEGVSRNGENTATSIKRTSVENNNRTYTDADEPEYQWGFTPGSVNPADPYENVLGASKFSGVIPGTDNIQIASGLVLKMRDFTRVSVSDGRQINTVEALRVLQNRQNNNFDTWLNYQVDSRLEAIWVDKLHIVLNGIGDEVSIPRP